MCTSKRAAAIKSRIADLSESGEVDLLLPRDRPASINCHKSASNICTIFCLAVLPVDLADEVLTCDRLSFRFASLHGLGESADLLEESERCSLCNILPANIV